MKEYDVFVTLTSYQFFIAYSYAQYIRRNYSETGIYILSLGNDFSMFEGDGIFIYFVPNLNSNKCDRIWQRLYYAGRLFNFSRIGRLIKGLLIKRLYIFNDNEPITAKVMRVAKNNSPSTRIIMIEEGIGTYATTTKMNYGLKEQVRLLITNILGSPMQYKSIGDNHLIDTVIVGNPQLYRSLKKAEGKKILKQNKELMFRNSRNFINRFSNGKIENYDNVILYLGQPFDEYGELTQLENALLQKLFSMLTKYSRVLIKPHPRDLKGKYSSLISEQVRVISDGLENMPIEVLVGGINCSIVISQRSSAGINIANAYKNIKSVFLYKIPAFANLEKDIMKSFNHYSDEIFKGKYENVFLPHTENELADIVKRYFTLQQVDFFTSSELSFDEIDEIMA